MLEAGLECFGEPPDPALIASSTYACVGEGTCFLSLFLKITEHINKHE